MNKPIYIGQCVLDTSKVIMYKLFDQWKQNPMCEQVQLIGGDTDSFFLKVVSPHDRNTILKSFESYPNLIDPTAKGIFDSSNYPKTHPLYSETNKSRLGCFKDEVCGRTITEFICLSPKMYSYELADHTGDRRAKGVKKYKKDSLSHQDFRDVYTKHCIKHVTQTYLRSTHHEMRTIEMKKAALNIWEDKRCWTSYNQSLPYGNHQLYKNECVTQEISHVSHLKQNGGNARKRRYSITGLDTDDTKQHVSSGQTLPTLFPLSRPDRRTIIPSRMCTSSRQLHGGGIPDDLGVSLEAPISAGVDETKDQVFNDPMLLGRL